MSKGAILSYFNLKVDIQNRESIWRASSYLVVAAPGKMGGGRIKRHGTKA
jgi:hypothetical protein